jgi:hypothetical protein
MANIKFDAKTKTVTVSFQYDPAKEYPVSKSGKSRMVDTTNGFAAIPGTVGRLSLNVINPADYTGVKD